MHFVREVLKYLIARQPHWFCPNRGHARLAPPQRKDDGKIGPARGPKLSNPMFCTSSGNISGKPFLGNISGKPFCPTSVHNGPGTNYFSGNSLGNNSHKGYVSQKEMVKKARRPFSVASHCQQGNFLPQEMATKSKNATSCGKKLPKRQFLGARNGQKGKKAIACGGKK